MNFPNLLLNLNLLFSLRKIMSIGIKFQCSHHKLGILQLDVDPREAMSEIIFDMSYPALD